MFSICNRTFVLALFNANHTFIQHERAHSHSHSLIHIRANVRALTRWFANVFIWIHGNGRSSPRHILPFRVLSLALMLPFSCSVRLLFLMLYAVFFSAVLSFHEHHSTHVAYICATNTQPSNQLKHFFFSALLCISLYALPL